MRWSSALLWTFEWHLLVLSCTLWHLFLKRSEMRNLYLSLLSGTWLYLWLLHVTMLWMFGKGYLWKLYPSLLSKQQTMWLMYARMLHLPWKEYLPSLWHWEQLLNERQQMWMQVRIRCGWWHKIMQRIRLKSYSSDHNNNSGCSASRYSDSFPHQKT